ncbi:MAG: DUF748 domain-containing protein [Cyclobacteriaceae bacterium]|nr:DUF748 domain-containing protein [Cyclobacteriaceae bacterium]
MARGLKILALLFTVLIFTSIFTIGIITWWVFTPEKITPVIREQAAKHLNCSTSIGRVELTFFSTFPDFAFKINELQLLTLAGAAPNDTLLDVGEAVLRFDLMKLWNHAELNIHEITLKHGKLNLFTDSLGVVNYNIWQPADPANEEDESFSLELINAENIILQQIDLRYEDASLGVKAIVENLHAEVHGSLKQGILHSVLKVAEASVSLDYQQEEYLSHTPTKFQLLSSYDFNQQHLRITAANLQLNEVSFTMHGDLDLSSEAKGAGLQYELPEISAESLLKLVPPAFASFVEDLDFAGDVYFKGSLEGEYSNEKWPWIRTDLRLRNGRINHAILPFPLDHAEASISITTDFFNDTSSFIHIESASAVHKNSRFQVSGNVKDIYSDALLELRIATGLDLDEITEYFPKDLKLTASGTMDGNLQTTFRLSELEKNQWEKFRVRGNFYGKALRMANDSLEMRCLDTEVRLQMPNPKPALPQRKFALVNMKSGLFALDEWKKPRLTLQNALLHLETSDLRDTIVVPHMYLSYGLDSLGISLDTLIYQGENPTGTLTISPCRQSPHLPSIEAGYASDKVTARYGMITADLKKTNLSVKVNRDDRFQDAFKQWMFEGFVHVIEGYFQSPDFRYSFELPVLSMDFEPETFNIKESHAKIGSSDFSLAGSFQNVMSYFREDSILRGTFIFQSDTTDVFQLMNLTSGLGHDDPPEDENQGPYMVPQGLDISLQTNIGYARMGHNFADHIGGVLRVRDGTLVLDDIQLETPAARMELTAMYRTPRKNHLFLGLDYRMVDVEIEELLEMIPDIDTLMPMLRSFKGTGEFHIAVETYLDSMYNIKKSTLRGASSITGQNLVLMDGETFGEIAKTLRFNKKTENIVDSLSTEFTIFREEIDIYPFLMVMDRYKAVIAGRHNFDLTFDYHVSVVESPLPFRLGVDIRGDIDNLSYSLARARYAEFYRPTRRGVVENRQLELRRMIREALMGTTRTASE